MNINNFFEYFLISGKWFIIYTFPFFTLLFLLIRKVNFKIQKKRQSWLYFCEIYYVSLFLTMIFTNLQTGVFWLWKSSENLDTILNRFFICYGIYQIFVLVKRKLDSSANADSYQSMKTFLNRLIIYKEADMNKEFVSLVKEYEDKIVIDKITMLNPICLDTFNKTKQYDFNDDKLIIFLKVESERLDHNIQTEAFSWVESFLLNIFK